MFWSTRTRQALPPQRPRVLCHLNHFYGRASTETEFGSAVTPRAIRHDIVQRTIAALRALPFDVDLRVCGFKDHALVPVDIDLSAIGEPQRIVYESLQRMLGVIDQYDWFLNIEDDILIEPQTLERMMAFAAQSPVNEILLPNRVETSGTGEIYCVDLLAMPGWKSLRNEFDGLALDVADNPHSALMFLSREQMQYARDRVQWTRRDRIVGGLMASAYANAHQAFLLWRSKDNIEAHCVMHLDRWSYSDTLLAAQGETTAREMAEEEQLAPAFPNSIAQVHIDAVSREGASVIVNGWAAFTDGRGCSAVAVDFGTPPQICSVAIENFKRIERPDVNAAVPGVENDCGFSFEFPLLSFATVDSETDLSGIDVRLTLLNYDGASEPAMDAVATTRLRSELRPLLAQIPQIPTRPFMPDVAAARLAEAMRKASCYLEFGTGGTTVTARRLGVAEVVGVESDELWLKTLELKLGQTPADGLHLLHVDIGPTGEWGYPLSEASWRRYRDYPLAPWEYCARRSLSPDLVLIDGRFRRACFLASCLLAKPGTRILFDDYLDRPHYHDVEDFVDRSAVFDRVVEFIVPLQFSRDEMWIRLTQALSDVS
ncbi:hypothetical protein [Paraburkholderia sp. J67]|uniref:hypothetical protein n=1 Tax=Paraburkholderia sp. J67 TaxID=2805435 RepID=UPI002ABE2622|nr:hypothetical protein [Paraburkholderia sp. J67]